MDTLEFQRDPFSFDASPVTGSSSSDDVMVTSIHLKKLSSALRRHQAGRRMAPLSFEPAHGVPQFYRGLVPPPCVCAEDRKDDRLAV
jgi:hypothetical protein